MLNQQNESNLHQDQIGESLSAMVDSEASELETRRVLKQAANNDSLKAKWRRYFLAQTIMHSSKKHKKEDQATEDVSGLDSSFVSFDISSAVSTAIAGESAYTPDKAQDTKERFVLFKAFGQGLAVASTCLFAIWGVGQFSQINEKAFDQHLAKDTKAPVLIEHPQSATVAATSASISINIPSLIDPNGFLGVAMTNEIISHNKKSHLAPRHASLSPLVVTSKSSGQVSTGAQDTINIRQALDFELGFMPDGYQAIEGKKGAYSNGQDVFTVVLHNDPRALIQPVLSNEALIYDQLKRPVAKVVVLGQLSDTDLKSIVNSVKLK